MTKVWKNMLPFTLLLIYLIAYVDVSMVEFAHKHMRVASNRALGCNELCGSCFRFLLYFLLHVINLGATSHMRQRAETMKL